MAVVDNQRGAMFRPIVPNQHSRVTYAELFFDLVFVFAVTQISHTLLGRFTPLGALQVTAAVPRGVVGVGLHLLDHQLAQSRTHAGPDPAVLADARRPRAVDLDSDRRSRPAVSGSRGAYAAMQVGRTLFWLVSIPRGRILGAHECDPHPGLAVAVGACSGSRAASPDGHARLVLWAVALLIEYISPAVRFWIPKYGASSVADWVVEGGHMAERCAGFIIIALGESIVVTGATFADLTWSAENIGAFVSAFIGSIAMWWIYFHKGAEAGSELISRSSEPGRLARLAYTYLHMPIVAGIILSAVADELVLTHPDGHSDLRTVVSAIGGPLLFLLGTILFKHTIRGFLQLSHGVGIIALRDPGLVRRRPVAVAAVGPDHRDHDHRRGVGIDLAAVRRRRDSVRSHQRVNRKHARRVGPGCARRPAGAARQRREALEAVFVAALGVDAFAGAE